MMITRSELQRLSGAEETNARGNANLRAGLDPRNSGLQALGEFDPAAVF